jgi:hypothetical protein
MQSMARKRNPHCKIVGKLKSAGIVIGGTLMTLAVWLLFALIGRGGL